MMFRNANQTVIGLIASVFLIVGCSGEQPAGTATESGAEPAGEIAVQTAVAQEGHSGVIEGVVRDSSGQPLAGAFVKLKNAERRLTFMYVSQDEGRYTAKTLPAGNYVVQGVGGDFESAWSSPVEIEKAGSAHMDVSLNLERAPYLAPAWTRRTPEYEATASHIPEGPGKDIIMSRCTACHTETRIISRRVDREDWEPTLNDMRELMIGANMPDLTDEDATVLIDYLATNFPPMGPPDPNSRFPRELQEGEGRNYRVVQYELENTGAENHDIAVDPWGVGWANQRLGGKIGRFDPVTYEFSEINLPQHDTQRVRPGNPQITKDGMMWVSDAFGNRWLSYDIAREKWAEYPFPSEKIRGPAYGNTMAFHPDGTVWSSGPGTARRLNPVTGEWSAWDTPSWLATGMNPGGYGITVAGDGRVWMAQNQVDRFARFDGKTGEVVEFEIPVEGTDYPRRMDHDPDGNVWIALWSAGKIVRIDYKTDEMTVIEPPIPHNGVYAIDFDESSGLMWSTLHTRDIIARYNPETEEWLMLPLPQAETDSRRVEVDQNNPNRVWWSSVAYDARIGFVELLENDL